MSDIEGEREELLRRLTSGALDDLNVIERSFERRAIAKRLQEIDYNLQETDPQVLYGAYGYDGNE